MHQTQCTGGEGKHRLEVMGAIEDVTAEEEAPGGRSSTRCSVRCTRLNRSPSLHTTPRKRKVDDSRRQVDAAQRRRTRHQPEAPRKYPIGRFVCRAAHVTYHARSHRRVRDYVESQQYEGCSLTAVRQPADRCCESRWTARVRPRRCWA